MRTYPPRALGAAAAEGGAAAAAAEMAVRRFSLLASACMSGSPLRLLASGAFRLNRLLW